MKKTIAEVPLPVDEVLKIQKKRIEPDFNDSGKRISIVTGVHGDELEGQYVCCELCRRIEQEKEMLTGIVDIYPAMNPLGIDSITRGLPAFDLDMNRIFPGNSDGAMTEYIASCIMDDLMGSDLCIDIHASNIFLTEVPQIRINELHKEWLVPMAEKMNVDFIWVHSNATVLKSTLAFSLNSREIPTLVVEMGVGMRITKQYGDQLVDGILNVMKDMGIWQGTTVPVRKPMVSVNEDDVAYLNAPKAGVFVKTAEIGQYMKKGEEIGQIINPLGDVLQTKVLAPIDGVLFTIREYPVVDEGSLVARVLKKDEPYCVQLS